MKCYYEILEIPRDADDNEIKTSYRKLALKWHPDKNINNQEEAKEQFQLVQQAYEVLSDRQERAWYDNHREQILHGSNSEYKDDSLDVFQYFTSQCFKGYGDDDNGFYTVYRKVFEQISKEDIAHMDSKSDYDEIPPFGTSTSDYEDIVGPFYAYWSSYTTKKSYVWLDPYNIREATNGRVLKLIEKENKKVRQKAKKERNEEVRNLVAFVRKRDKRVQAYAKKLEEKTVENRMKQEKLRKQKILENKKELSNSKHAEWTKFDNVKHELKEIEKHLAEQFGESLSDSEISNESEEENDLYCVACNKVFKNPKAFANHESSKKHKENVEYLKQTQGIEEESEKSDEEDNFDSFEEDENDLYCVACDKEFKNRKALLNHETSEKHIENVEKLKQSMLDEEKKLQEINSTEDKKVNGTNEPEIPEIGDGGKKKNKKNKKVIRIQKMSVTEDSELSDMDLKKNIETTSSDHEFDTKSSKKTKKKNKQKPAANTKKPEEAVETPLNEENENNQQNEIVNNKKDKKAKKAPKKNITIEDIADIDTTHNCVICKSNFPSKNKLFEHLKKTGHSVALPDKPSKSRRQKVK